MAGQYRTPTYDELVGFWNAGHAPRQATTPQNNGPVAGSLLWATEEQAAAYEAPPGVPVVLFIRGKTEAHVKSHNERGEPTTAILDYTERAPVDTSPYATKEQVTGLQAQLNELLSILRGGNQGNQGQEGISNDQQS